MKNLCLILVAITATSLTAHAQNAASDVEAKVAAAATVSSFVDSWNRADGAAYGENYWPDAELVNPSGEIVDGRAAIAQEHVELWAEIFKGSRMAVRCAGCEGSIYRKIKNSLGRRIRRKTESAIVIYKK